MKLLLLRTEQHRVHSSGDNALWSAQAELLCLVGEPARAGDGVDINVGDVLSPHGVGLDEAVELRKKWRAAYCCENTSCELWPPRAPRLRGAVSLQS
jgi:hypothetical protein